MKVEILSEDELKIKFILRDSDYVFANAWRRAMKSLVPTLAVDYVDFYLNTSLLYDEIIAHRIGLIPLKTDLERYNFQDKCVCGGEGCPNCQVSLRLNVEGPKTVYSGDLVPDDPEVKPVYDNIPIVELYEGQQLMLEAVARLGTGREHAKFQPVSVCFYKIIPKIEITEDCTACMKCVDACPRKILKNNDGKVEVENVLECSMCRDCVRACDANAIIIEETNDFLFTVEGVGQLPIRVVMRKALEILKEKAEEANKILEELS